MSATPLLSDRRRSTCAHCLRAASACICAWVKPVASPHALLILQHPLEVKDAKNSGRLLHLCVAGSRLVVGEEFAPEELRALLFEGGVQPVLLYPEMPGLGPAMGVELAQCPSLRLVLLDATWRKSRKMLYLNPLLQALPRLSPAAVHESHYLIRKAHQPGQLSTMEAAFHVMSQLDPQGSYQPLLDSFAGFVGQQAGYAAKGD